MSKRKCYSPEYKREIVEASFNLISDDAQPAVA